MRDFLQLLRHNRNYRYTWMGQVVSEIGDNFNNIAVVALGFIVALRQHQVWLLYAFSALLMVASPFFTAGRSAILPTIANKEEIHTANSLTQTTQWTNLTIGTFLGATVVGIGYGWAFTFNALSFVFSAWALWNLRPPAGKQ